METTLASQIVNYFVEKTGKDFEDLQAFIKQTEIANDLLVNYPLESIIACIDAYCEKIYSLAYLEYVIEAKHNSLLAAKVNASIFDNFVNWSEDKTIGRVVRCSTPRWLTTMKGGGENL